MVELESPDRRYDSLCCRIVPSRLDVKRSALALLGVNIDHVATVREARKTNEPDPVWAATLAELGGADAITVHLREDRRHIQERDLRVLVESVAVPINLELACADDVLAIACETAPYQATLVPERREEVTTEGGLDVVGGRKRVAEAVKRLQDAGIKVSLFLDPDEAQLAAGAELGVDAIELHTGAYAHASAKHHAEPELATLVAAEPASSRGRRTCSTPATVSPIATSSRSPRSPRCAS